MTRMSLDSGIVCDNSIISSPDSSALQSPSDIPVKEHKKNIPKMILTPKLRAKRKYMADQTQGYVAAAKLYNETTKIMSTNTTKVKEQLGSKILQSPDEKENNATTTDSCKFDKKFYCADVPCVSGERIPSNHVVSRKCEIIK